MMDNEDESSNQIAREMYHDIGAELKLMKFQFNNYMPINRDALIASEIERVSRQLFWHDTGESNPRNFLKEMFIQEYVRTHVVKGKMKLIERGDDDPLNDRRVAIEAHAKFLYLKWLRSKQSPKADKKYSVPEYATALYMKGIVINKQGIGRDGVNYSEKFGCSSKSLYNKYIEVTKDSKLQQNHSTTAKKIIDSNIL